MARAELLKSSLTKREAISANLCLGTNRNLLREEAGNWPECQVRSSFMWKLFPEMLRSKIWGKKDHR